MVMLTPARSVANRTRVSTVPPFGMVILAIRKDSRSTKTSSTPTPRRMNIPTKLSDVNGTPVNVKQKNVVKLIAHTGINRNREIRVLNRNSPKKMTTPYPLKTLRATQLSPKDACDAELTSGRVLCSCVSTALTNVNVNEAMTSGISPVTERAVNNKTRRQSRCPYGNKNNLSPISLSKAS